MSGKLVIIVIIALITGGYCFAQMVQLPSYFQLSSLNITGRQYLPVDSQRQAIFRVNAPQVQSLVVSLGNTALIEGEDKHTGTTMPLNPGFHYEALEKAGIKQMYYESPGTSYEWITWRRDLRESASLLFKD